MSLPKPKLLIIGGPGVPAEELSRYLGQRFDIVVGPPGSAASHLREEDIQAVVAESCELQEMAAHPATLLLNAIGEGVCLVGLDGSEVWSNERFRSLPETTRARVRVCIEEAAGALFPRGETLATPGPTCKFELSDPRDQLAHEVFIVAAGEPKIAPRLAVVVRDVSKERRFAVRMSAIDRAGAELVGFEAESVRTHNSAERLKALETRIVRIAHELLHFDHFLIRLIEKRTGRLEPVIAAGLPQEALDLELFAEEEGNGLSGHVAATGRSVVCADADTDPRFMPGLGNAKSSLTVPLRLHDKIIGVMNVESQQAANFTDEDRQFCEIFARYIAISLHMLDLLVVERSTTNLSVSGRVEGELKECLEDILSEADWLTGAGARDPETARHIARIKADVESIRARVRNMAAGPQTLLGVERALADRTEDPVLKGRRVLVADDESKIRRIIRDVLRSRGCTVEICESGGEAIDRLGAPEATFDVVISDIKMPDRNGYEVFSAARKAIPSVPVILMTGFGYDPHHSIVRASQEGLQSVLFKPFQIERLIDEVRKALTPK
ncbi:MAG: response regulator [Phycisphaerales bacterium]|nr:response regulator [Phycisphaerales bacterium]